MQINMFGVLNTGIFILAGISGLCKISAQFNVTCFFIYLTKQKTPFLKTMCKFILFLKDIQKKNLKISTSPQEHNQNIFCCHAKWHNHFSNRKMFFSVILKTCYLFTNKCLQLFNIQSNKHIISSKNQPIRVYFFGIF